MKINVAGIIGESIVDGPGIRTTVFCQGCPHHCPGCQNPETWAFEERNLMSPEDILEIIQKNPLVHGVTFSGGEPFEQGAAFAELAKLLREKGYEVAAYSGYTFEQLYNGTEEQKQLLENIDILVDGPFLHEQRSMDVLFRGSKNQRIINVPLSLESKCAICETHERWVGSKD